MLKNTCIFLSLFACMLIIFHHYVKHENDADLTKFQKIFQIKDVSNHEAFVFLFLGIFIGLLLSKIIN